MTPGLRKHKSATARIAVPMGLPEEMRDQIRELIDVHSENQRKGHASALLRNLCKEADADWLTLLVQVYAYDDGMSSEQLRKWYAKFGFVLVQEDPMLMARSPQ